MFNGLKSKMNSMTFRIFMSIGLLVLLIVLFIGQQNLANLDRVMNAQFEAATNADAKMVRVALDEYVNKLRSGALAHLEMGRDGAVKIKDHALSGGVVEISALSIVSRQTGREIQAKRYADNCPKQGANWSELSRSEDWLLLRSLSGGKQHFNGNCIELAIDLSAFPVGEGFMPRANKSLSGWLVVTTTNQRLNEIARSAKSGYTSFYDRSGRVIARSGLSREESISLEVSPKRVRGIVAASLKSPVVESTRALNGSEVLAISHQTSKDAVISYLISVKPDVIYLDFFRAKRELILYGVLFLLIAILMSFALATRLAQPIREISSAAREIARGNFAIRIKVKGVNEITTLAGSVNDLSEQIETLMVKQRELGRISAEVETARLVQETLYPENKIEISRQVRASSFTSMASECGGDLWGTISLPDDRQCIYIGDASGHGVPAAFITIAAHSSLAMISAMAHARGLRNWGPSEILKYLNNAILEVGNGQILMPMFVGVINNSNGTIEYANAGHTKPIALRHESGGQYKCQSLTSSGSPLGFVKDLGDWSVETAPFSAKDKLVLYTDGLIENVQNQTGKFSKRDIHHMLVAIGGGSAPEICKAIEARYNEALNGTAPADDCTIVVLERVAV